MLDELHRDGRSQAIVATHSPVLMSHPGADLLWVDKSGVTRRKLADVPHWKDMAHFMTHPKAALTRLLGDSPARDDAAVEMPTRKVRLWILSDLHLEAVPHPEAFRPKRPDFDILVVAGDVWEGDIARGMQVVAALADGKPAVFVMGNHESWEGDIQRQRDVARRTAKRLGIVLLDDSQTEVMGVSFVGGTLWADGRLGGQDATPAQATGESIQVMRDGALRPITVGDEVCLHARTRGVIEAAMARPRDGKLVVVTHHAPLPDCLAPSHRNTWTAGNSASDLSALTDNGQVALWIHGHVHRTIDMTRSGGTRVVCNAAGPGFTNLDFQDDWVVDV